MFAFHLLLLFGINCLKNIRLVSTSAVLVLGGLLVSSIATNTHSANAAVEDYEINAVTISGDQQNTDFINRVGASSLLMIYAEEAMLFISVMQEPPRIGVIRSVQI